jgi:hypothetical protein
MLNSAKFPDYSPYSGLFIKLDMKYIKQEIFQLKKFGFINVPRETLLGHFWGYCRMPLFYAGENEIPIQNWNSVLSANLSFVACGRQSDSLT